MIINTTCKNVLQAFVFMDTRITSRLIVFMLLCLVNLKDTYTLDAVAQSFWSFAARDILLLLFNSEFICRFSLASVSLPAYVPQSM